MPVQSTGPQESFPLAEKGDLVNRIVVVIVLVEIVIQVDRLESGTVQRHPILSNGIRFYGRRLSFPLRSNLGFTKISTLC